MVQVNFHVSINPHIRVHPCLTFISALPAQILIEGELSECKHIPVKCGG